MRWQGLLNEAWREGIALYMLAAHGVRLDEGEETMPVQGVNMIKHHVNDWPAAMVFYRDALGLRLIFEQPGSWASFEAPDGSRIGLVGEHEGVRRTPHVLLRVDQLAAMVADLTARGQIVEPATTTDYGEVAVVRDPAGNVIELVQPG